VLLYEIIRYRDCELLFSEEHIQSIFGRPTGYFDSPDNGKIECLVDTGFHRILLKMLVKTPCRKIIADMRSLIVGLYISKDYMGQSSDEEDPGRGPPVSDARENLRTSDAFLAILEKHLGTKWEIDDDGSLDRPELQPDGTASRKRLKRKAGDRSDSSEENINVRRRGRLPPSTEESDSDEDTSWTCCSSDSGWGHADNSSVSSRASWVE
jgi:hypothetical protein